MSVRVPKPGDGVERDDRDMPPVRQAPPKRSYTRRRAGSRAAEATGPLAAPTLIEASVAVHREQARGSDSDVLPTMVENSPFGSEPGAGGVEAEMEMSPEQAEFDAALARSRRRPSARCVVEASGREPSRRFETEGGVAKTLYLTPVELAVDLAASTDADGSSPTLWSAPPPIVTSPKSKSPRLLFLFGALGVALVLCAVLLGWMLLNGT